MVPLWLSLALVLVRVATLVTVLPVFGGQSVPRLVKVGLAVSLTVFWVEPALVSAPLEAGVASVAETSWLLYGVAAAREAVLGALLGYSFGLFLVPARIAGEYPTQELGLSFSAMLNPTDNSSAGPLTQLFDLFGILVFFALNMHHVLLAVFDSLFGSCPVGSPLPRLPIASLIGGAGLAQEWGILLVASMGACLFLITVVLSLLARAAPQFQLYAVGFPLRLIIGWVVVLLLLPGLITVLVVVQGRWGEFLTSLWCW